MQYTNRLGLPRSIVNAVSNDPYDAQGSLSVTTLVGPPQIARLRQKFSDQLTEDVSDRMWAFYGQLGHSVGERAVQEGDIAEVRVFGDVGGVKVSGKFDLLEKDGTLTDFKFTSVFAMKDREPKPEWVAQLNLLRILITLDTSMEWPIVRKLQIVAMARDWRPGEALRDSGYPGKAMILPVQMWTNEEALDYLAERVRVHTLPVPPPCTDEERWFQPGQFALMKKGAKRAVRLFDGKPESVVLASDQYWEERPSAYRRCENYCPVSAHCPQWAATRQSST